MLVDMIPSLPPCSICSLSRVIALISLYSKNRQHTELSFTRLHMGLDTTNDVTGSQYSEWKIGLDSEKQKSPNVTALITSTMPQGRGRKGGVPPCTQKPSLKIHILELL